MNVVRRMDESIDSFIKVTTIVAFCVNFCMVLSSVSFRFLHMSAISWMDDIIDLCSLWLVFVGSQMVMRKNGHVSVQLLVSLIRSANPIAGRLLSFVNNLLVLVFLSFFSVALFSYTKEVAAPAYLARIPISKAWWMIPVVLGFILMIEHTVRVLVSIVRGGEEHDVLR